MPASHPFLLTDAFQEKLVFQQYWPPIQLKLSNQLPARFAPMAEADQTEFGRQAFLLCQQSALFMDDEVHFVCVMMALFGHRFFADPRFFTLSNLLFDKTHTARLRRAKLLVSPLIAQVWGQPAFRHSMMTHAAHDLAALRFERPTSGAFAPCDVASEMFSQWQPWPLDQNFFLTHAQEICSRLNVQGPEVVDVCFWAIWLLGIEFDRNPQFQWWIRMIDDAGVDPARRYKRFIDWLHVLATSAPPPAGDAV